MGGINPSLYPVLQRERGTTKIIMRVRAGEAENGLPVARCGCPPTAFPARHEVRLTVLTEPLKGFMPHLPYRLYGHLSTYWARWRFERWCSRIAKMEYVPIDDVLSPASRRGDEESAVRNALARIDHSLKNVFRAKCGDTNDAAKSKSPLLMANRLIAVINQLPDDQYVVLALHMRGLTAKKLAARRGITEEAAFATLGEVIHRIVEEGFASQ